MTAPNTTNNVTVRKLADVAEGMWNKSKNAFVNASGDTMTGRLTMENVPINQIVTGTGTAATSSTSGGTTTYYPAKWNFDLGIATPSAGDQLVIKIPVAGHDYGTFMSTDNGTTYYPVAQSTGATRFTTRYPVNAYVFIVFEEYTGSSNSGQVNDCFALTGSTGRKSYTIGCWRVVNDYDSGNNYDRLYTANGRFRTGTTGCYPYSLVCLDNTQSYSTLVTNNPGTGTNKAVNTDGKFVFPASILYYAGNNTTAAGALVSSTYSTYLAYPTVNVQYSSNHTTTFTTNKPVYIECTLNGDGTWSPTSNSITQTLRTSYYYIYLGIAYSTEYQVSLAPEHPLYYYDGTNLVSAEVARGDITAGTNNGELKVAGTDITVYTHPTDAGNKHIPAGGSSGQFLGYDSDGTAKWVSNPNTDTKVKATAKTDNANYKILATASASPTSGAATEAVYDTDITLNPSTNTISANVSGTAASAGKLTTARTTYVTLGTASTSTTRDWSGTTTIPVSGTLGIGNGGTGATSAAGARTNLDVYSKSETESLLNGKVVVVTQLPATGESGVTYYVKDTSSSAVDKYDEYIWAKDAGASTESWIHVGEKSIDLSNYVNALSTSGSGPLVASLSKSGNTLTATMGTISIDDLSDWATDTDVTVSSVTYHTWWPVAPTSSNQVYGLSMYNGRLFRIYNNKGTYSAQAYDVNTTYTNKSLGQGYGTCATDSSTAAKIVSMSYYALTTGGIVTVKFTNALCTSATMNINGKGAKPIYIKGAAVTANNAATVSAGDTAYFMYDGTAYHLLGTDRAATNPIVNISRSGTTFTATRLDGTTFTFTQQDNNTTYTQAKLGQGYGTCTTAEATAAKSVTLTGYELEPNGVVAVKFTNGLCASATMSINGKTATPIYINGAAVTSTSCKEVLAGDLAFFIYDGSHYQFICTDRISKNGITGLSISGRTITYTRADGTTGTLTTQDTTYSFDGEYNASTNKVATVSTVTNAVNALDVDDITGFGAGKTLATLTETDGKIAATFQDISITKSQVSDFSHAHGNITNDGKVGTTADYAVVTTTGGAVTATSLATSSPSTSGNTLEFIDTVSQNSKGKISATKKKVTIDDTYSSTGTNPVSGKAIAAAIETLDVTEVGGDGKYIKKIKEDNGKISATVETMDTTPTASSTKAVTSGGIKTALDTKADDSNVVHKTGNETVGGTKTFSDETVFSTVHRDTRYASNLCNYFESNKYPTNVVVWTKCRWVSNAVMPIIRIYGNSYNPRGGAWELKIFYYVYNDALTRAGVVSIGNFKPGVYLWKYTDSSDNTDYVAIGLTTEPAYTIYPWYYRGFQVDVQLPAAGSWAHVKITGWSTSSNGADTTQVIIPEEGTSGCVEVSYEPISTDISGNAATASAAQTGSALETAIDNKANIANSVYYVVGSHDYTAYSTSATYSKWTSGAYTSSNSCVYGGVAYYCSTAISTPEAWTASHWTKIPTPTWTGTIDGITELSTGLKIAYKVPIAGGSSSTTLNINGLGAKYIRRNDSNTTTYLPVNTVVFLAYDGTYWRWADYDSNSTYSGMVTAYINNAGDAAKTAASTNFKLTNGITIILSNNAANTRAAALTLNVNSTGAKPLYINGEISSATNYTIPIGTYFCHYDGTNWNLWTDGTFQTFRVAGPADYASDALPGSELERKLDSKLDADDIETFGSTATYDEENHRLIFDDILFDSIFPKIGKYGLAIFGSNTASTFSDTTDTKESPVATEFAGDREWLLDWRPYLVDMTAIAGETAKRPVAELKKNNWLRKTDGSYATVAGITATQSTACNVELYWDSAHTKAIRSDVATAYDGSTTTFVPSAFWEYVNSSAGLTVANTRSGTTYSCAIEVKLYNSSGTAFTYGAYNNNHIVAPWETTETKYSVFIGRETECYLVDGYSLTTGEYMRGLTKKALPVGSNEFDPEDYRLRRTGISPGPSTTVGNKARNFFFNYPGTDSNTTGKQGTVTSSVIFNNNGTYPRVNDVSQYSAASYARSCNTGGAAGNAVPVGEGGFHALNAFLCAVESGFGTRLLHADTMFGSGISANSTANATNGGLNVAGTWYQWDATNHGLGNTNNASYAINTTYPKFQCMEPQIALSLTVEMGLAENATFKWNGGTWHYELPTAVTGYPITGPLDGEMNCRIYKQTDTVTINSKSVYCMLRCALIEGVNPVGDIMCYNGGGAELVYMTNGSSYNTYDPMFYLEPDQSKWYIGADTVNTIGEKHTDGSLFSVESTYMSIPGVTTGLGGGATYVKTRVGYSPWCKVTGGSITTYDSTYHYRPIEDDAKGSTSIRSRRSIRTRGAGPYSYTSPRTLNSNNRPSYVTVTTGFATQVLLA